EQDADMVMFLNRPDYYDINTNSEGEDQKGLTEVKIAKHRNGSLETIKLKALLHIQKFIAWEDDPYNAIGLGGGTWRPVDDSEGGGARLFQAQSKMNNMSDDELDEAPF